MIDTVQKTVKGKSSKFLTFLLGHDVYGLEIQCVTEIIGIQEITSIPELPDYIKGIINLRGEIIPVMDVRARLKKEVIAYADRTCIIVVKIDDISLGLIVDAVSEVLIIPEDNIVSPQEINNLSGTSYIKGIGKVGDSIKLLLDCSKMISTADYEALKNI